MIPELAIIAACGAGVAPATTQAIIQAESSGNPLALNVNRFAGAQPRARDAAHAAQLARVYIDAGYSVDIGLMQVNSRNLPRLGLTVETVLDPCENIRAGTTILREAYRAARQTQPHGDAALKVALSIYNTGNGTRGFRNGYVARYYGPNVRRAAPAPTRASSPAPYRLTPYNAPTGVYSRAAVASAASPAGATP
jgi:type IV secretion system protein VirB1